MYLLHVEARASWLARDICNLSFFRPFEQREYKVVKSHRLSNAQATQYHSPQLPDALGFLDG